MIRVECVGVEDGEPQRFARRAIPRVKTDEDAVLLCPQHRLDEEQAELIYDELGASHTEWVGDHFQFAAERLGTTKTLGFLFLETFGERGIEYEVALNLNEGEGGAMQASLEVTDYRWKLIKEEGVTVPYRYKICENLVSGVWFNAMIDRYDLNREPFEIGAAE